MKPWYLYLAGLIILFTFAFGYIAGRKKGRREGLQEGEMYAPLELRRRGLENGWCPICCSKLGPCHGPMGRRSMNYPRMVENEGLKKND